MILASRPNCARPTHASPARHALLLSTILGAGVLGTLSVPAQAQVFTIDQPVTVGGGNPGVVHLYGSPFGDTPDEVPGTNLTIITTATVTSTDNSGIVAVRNGSDNISIDVGAAATGLTNGVYTRAMATGSLLVTGAGTISSTGFYNGTSAGQAIFAQTNGGSITISGTGATTSTGAGRAIEATVDSGAGNITINRSGIITAGTDGIWATTAGSGGISISGIGPLTSGSGGGIYAASTSGAVNINVGADVTGGSTAIEAQSTSGSITIATAAGTLVQGNGGGAIETYATNGGVTILTINGDVLSSTNRGAVWARGTSGSITISGAGNVGLANNLGTGGGLAASTTTGAVTLTGTGNVSGVGGRAVDLKITDPSATADITVTRSGTYTSLSGAAALYAYNAGSGNISITGIGTVYRSGNFVDSAAIHANASGGNVTLSTGIVTSVDANGIEATTLGNGQVNVTLGGNITSYAGAAVSASTGSGAINITSGTGVTIAAPMDRAVWAFSNSGTITIGGQAGLGGRVSGNSGIYAETSGTGAIAVKTASGATVSTTEDGIRTVSNGSGATTIDIGGSITTGAGDGPAAVSASSANGDITITSASNVSLSSTLNSGSGIKVITANGNVDVGGAAGLGGPVSGNGNGILVFSGDTGTINIKTASGATVSSSTDAAISTSAKNGATTINLGANVTGSTFGIDAVSAGTGNINATIASGVTVTGATAAVRFSLGGSGSATLNNYGTISGPLLMRNSFAYLNRAVNGTGSATLNNYGTVRLIGAQSITGFTTVNKASGVLAGTGSFGAVVAEAGSRILVGDRTLSAIAGVPQMGTLNASSLTLASGAIVDVRADFSGVADRIVASGAATLGGATLKIAATPQVDATWSTAKTFTVLTASSVTGTFGATQLDYAFLKATLSYTSTAVTMTLDRNWTSFGTYATSTNQKSVSDIFDRFQSQTSNPVISRVTTLTVSQAPVALAQLSGTGVVAARTQSFAAGGVFSGAINSEMGKFTSSAGGSSTVLSYAADTKIKTKAFDKVAAKPEPILDGRIWAQVLGGIGNMKADAVNPSQRSSNYGLAAGADTAINPNLRAGFALSLGQSSAKVSSLSTSTDSTWGQAALYAVATDGNTYAKGSLTYGYLDSETERNVTAFGTTDQAKGKFGANLFSLRFEAGQKFAFAPISVTPFLAFEPSVLMQNAYRETGPSSITLGFDRTTSRALPGTLGAKFDAAYDLGDLRMAPSVSVGWVHDFADSSSISPFFTALPGSNFTVAGSKGDRNLARTELNLEASPKNGLATFYLNARADVGHRTNAVRGVAGVALRF